MYIPTETECNFSQVPGLIYVSGDCLQYRPNVVCRGNTKVISADVHVKDGGQVPDWLNYPREATDLSVSSVSGRLSMKIQ